MKYWAPFFAYTFLVLSGFRHDTQFNRNDFDDGF
jgi:hypothetical protein